MQEQKKGGEKEREEKERDEIKWRRKKKGGEKIGEG